MKQLVSFDTDRIKNYVFATGKLKEIRGASAILDELNRIDMVDIASDFNADTIYANGGSGMFVVDSENSQTFIKSVQKLYHEKTITGSISGTSIELSNDNDIQNCLKNLAYRLRICKDSNPKSKSIVSHSYLRTCDSCGEEYAVDKHPVDDDLLCQSCLNKRKKDEKIKEEIEKLIKDNIDIDKRKLWHRLIDDLRNMDYPLSDRRRPIDFDELGINSTPTNYMGLIYADGNNMGKQLEKIKKLDKLKEFSQSIDEAIYYSVLTAINQHLKPYTEVLPFDILLLGGDDLVMVTTAEKVIDVAITVNEKFRELTEKICDEPKSISVGIAIAHAKFPFGSLLSLAEGALKSAKKESSKRKIHNDKRYSENGLINFMVVNSSSSLDFNNYYSRELTYSSGDDEFYRTVRPYNVEELKFIQNTIRNLKSFPRNKLHTLRESVWLSKNQSLLEGLTVLCRLKSNQRNELTNFLDYFKLEEQDMTFFPWIKRDQKYFTPFLDLTALYNFIS